MDGGDRMTNLKCRFCNKPLKNFVDAFTHKCKKIDKMPVLFTNIPHSRRNRKLKAKQKYKKQL